MQCKCRNVMDECSNLMPRFLCRECNSHTEEGSEKDTDAANWKTRRGVRTQTMNEPNGRVNSSRVSGTAGSNLQVLRLWRQRCVLRSFSRRWCLSCERWASSGAHGHHGALTDPDVRSKQKQQGHVKVADPDLHLQLPSDMTDDDSEFVMSPEEQSPQSCKASPPSPLKRACVEIESAAS
ncbi:hypothetical protein ACOMHN_051492 [Nucella lapillus]